MAEIFEAEVGIFKGFRESGREFMAELITPYQYESVPVLGSFLGVKVKEDEALLGRITHFYPTGALTSAEAEDYLARMQQSRRGIPEDIKETKLRYRVNVKLLGMIKKDREGKFAYSPGARILPHLGATVWQLTKEALRFTCNVRIGEEEGSVPIGYYALGNEKFKDIEVKFSFSRLRRKRTLVFARTGYGKSNLIKLLVSKLCEKEPEVGILIFDPEGEYFFPTAQGSGLADLPHVFPKLVVFTDRKPPSQEYQRIVAGSPKLDLREIPASHVVDICLPKERRETVYATRLKGFRQEEWIELVNLLREQRYRLDPDEIRTRYNITRDADAVIRNITPVVDRLHNPASSLPLSIFYHLAKGRVVIVDISLLSAERGMEITGLILKTVFNHNTRYFVQGEHKAVIPVIAIIEEAQNVLSPEKMEHEENPFVEWVKEGRKYDLGSVLVTQQPGAISDQLLSQGDNFFTLHLVSNVDFDALKRNNAHFSEDILSFLLNEPIAGNAYLWSAPDQPYVVSVNLFEFEEYAKKEKKKAEEEGIGAPLKREESAIEEWERITAELKAKLEQTVWEAIASERRVPVYTPRYNNQNLPNWGIVSEFNIRAQVIEQFLKNYPDVRTWMFPQYFEHREDGEIILRQSFITFLKIGPHVKGRREDKDREEDYLLISSPHSYFKNGKRMNPHVVILSKLPEGIELSSESEDNEPQTPRTPRMF